MRPIAPELRYRDESPDFKGNVFGISNSLANGANRDRSFNRGIRKQMEAIILAVQNKENITGVELGLGASRVDYTTREKRGNTDIEVMVEYKHWTGHLTSKRGLELALKLESQLTRHIAGGAGRFSVLRVAWPAFGELDGASQAIFREVISDIIAFGERHKVEVEFNG